MKGIIQGFAFFILMLGISLGLMFYVAYDAIRYQSRLILKQSLSETMMILAQKPVWEREAIMLQTLEEIFRLRKPAHQSYRLNVLGFIAEPLALRVRLDILTQHVTGYAWIGFEEVMIEVKQ